MVKSINNLRGKSDRHQNHEKLKYSMSHQQDALEHWWTKVIAPKQINAKVPKEPKVKVIKISKPRKARVISEISNQRLSKYKRDTHWVARSEDEYDSMHQIKTWSELMEIQ